MTATCDTCHLVHEGAALSDCALAYAAAMLGLLEKIGEPGTCRGCGASIFWVKHLRGNNVPYTPAGLNHFIDCSAAEQFRKKK